MYEKGEHHLRMKNAPDFHLIRRLFSISQFFFSGFFNIFEDICDRQAPITTVRLSGFPERLLALQVKRQVPYMLMLTLAPLVCYITSSRQYFWTCA